MVKAYAPPTARAAMVVGTATVVVGTLPVFLTGALAVELTSELAFGSTGLGLAVAVYRLTGAAASPWLGALADRLGTVRSIRLATLIAAVGTFGIALTAHSWAVLVFWLMFSGCAHALGQPATNRLLSNAIDPKRLGTAFGLKQSAPPASTMLAGLSVPFLALTLGWRAAYVLAGVLALIVMLGAGRRPPRAQRRPKETGPRQPLPDKGLIILLAASFGLGTSTSSASTTFYVDSAVAAGSTQQFAGTVLAIAGIASIASRITSGVMCDRMAGGHLYLCVGLLGVGAVGLLMLATGDPRWMTPGIAITLAGSWGINGVFWYALIRAYPEMPGRITGALFPGALLGSTAGPIAFGIVSDATSYPVAWLATAGVAVLAAAAIFNAARKLGARRAPTTP